MSVIEPIERKGLTQAGGDVQVSILSRDLDWLQLDIECSATPTAGTLAVYFRTPQADKFKPLRDENNAAVTIDLKDPYPIYLQNLCVDELMLRPTGFDADKTYTAFVIYKEASNG